MAADSGAVGVSLEALYEAAFHVNSVAEEYDQRLREVNDRFARFLDGGWTGKAGGAFDEARREWHTGTSEVRAGLAMMAKALGDNANAYQQQEQANAAALRPADIDLSSGLNIQY